MAYQGYAVKVFFSDGTFGEVQKIEGIKLEADVIELKTNSALGQYTRKKLPGRMKSGTITVTRGITGNSGPEFASWMDSVLQNGLGAKLRKDGEIKILDAQNNPVVQFSFASAWPVTWSAGQLDANQPDAQLESIELAHNGLSRDK